MGTALCPSGTSSLRDGMLHAKKFMFQLLSSSQQPFFTDEETGLKGEMTWSHEPGHLGSSTGLSLLPQFPSVE